jgi:hypothetical protein
MIVQNTSGQPLKIAELGIIIAAGPAYVSIPYKTAVKYSKFLKPIQKSDTIMINKVKLKTAEEYRVNNALAEEVSPTIVEPQKELLPLMPKDSEEQKEEGKNPNPKSGLNITTEAPIVDPEVIAEFEEIEADEESANEEFEEAVALVVKATKKEEEVKAAPKKVTKKKATTNKKKTTKK